MTGLATPLTAMAALVGGLTGGLYFWLLYRAVRLHAAAAPVHIVVPLHLLRGGLAIAVFWGLAQFGAWPLIAGLAGFVLARVMARRLVAGG